jgi:pimeloyl-ACP methyl ester carboxylesterase
VLDRDVVVEGSRIACRDGGGGGRPVVLVHGTPSHSYIWRQVAPGLAEAGYRVLVFDLLGYGRSERPLRKDTSVAAQSRILEQLLDVWKLDQADVVGHDIGGAATMILAIAKPERFRSLALIDTVSYDSWPSETWQKIIREHLHEYHRMPLEEFRKMIVGQLRMTVHNKERMSGEVLGAYLEPLSGELGKISFFAHQVSHYDSRYTQETAADLKKLAMPVKILWGEEDQWQLVYYAKRLAKDIPEAELTVVPEAGHFLMEDAPDRVTAELMRFFET